MGLCRVQRTQQFFKKLTKRLKAIGFKPSITDTCIMTNIFTNSKYAGDKEMRINVGGYIIFLLGIVMLRKLKMHKYVSLSSSEAEFVTLSETAKEIKFVVQVLVTIGIKVKLPIIIHIDNVGDIFMSKDASTSSKTRHINISF
jgi:hypothetical protein